MAQIQLRFRCSGCGATIRETVEQSGAPVQTACPDCGAVNLVDANTPQVPLPKSYPRGSMFCTRCHNVGTPKLVTPGSILVELILWLFILLPGLIYSIWRLTARHKACSSCGSKELVPLDSPAARQILGNG